MHLEGAECIARYASNFYAEMPAVTRNQFGKGYTYYIGTNMNSDGIAKVLDMAVLAGGVSPVINEATGLEVTCRKAEDCTYYFIFNFKDNVLPLPNYFDGFKDLLTGETVAGGRMMKQYDALLIAIAD